MTSGGCEEGEPERSEPTAEVSQGLIVGYDSNRVIDHTTNDKIGILSHEGMDAADQPCRDDCDRQSLPTGLKTPQNAPNEAKLESTQGYLPLRIKLSETEPESWKRSQSAACGAAPQDAGVDPFDPITPAGDDNGRTPARE